MNKKNDITKDTYVSFSSQITPEDKYGTIFKNLENQTKSFKNTEKILKRLNKNKSWVKGQYHLFEELFLEETNYVSSILFKLSKNLNQNRFKEEIINNLFIFKENFKIFIDLIINDFYENFVKGLNHKEESKIEEKTVNPKTLKFETMESIQEVNEEILENSEKSLKKERELTNENAPQNRLAKRNLEISLNKNMKNKRNITSSKEIKKLNISSEIKKDVPAKTYKNKSLSKMKNITPNYITNFIYLNYGINKKYIPNKQIKERKHSKSFKTNNSQTNNKLKEGKVKSFKAV